MPEIKLVSKESLRREDNIPLKVPSFRKYILPLEGSMVSPWHSAKDFLLFVTDPGSGGEA